MVLAGIIAGAESLAAGLALELVNNDHCDVSSESSPKFESGGSLEVGIKDVAWGERNQWQRKS